MDNSMAARPYSTLKGDPYRAYEELPAEVRRALQEALVDWCPLRAREWHLHLLRRERLRPAQAASFLIQTIRRQDQAEVAAFARTWSKGAEAYPHLAAGATLQSYVGPDGIPAAEPIPVAPREMPSRPKAQARPKARPKAQAKPGKRAKRLKGRRGRR
ncbi:DUF6525 family protein [Roseomonas sp. OT10]|uniref:DUF6525 family protein n=1 Tax=Roseomonas cutis TaxID=2897332 RepID=UPI001E2C3F7C|nr:DUF6525 family protein [Roseomonas sp. OT10]UFN47657.1 DUF6525 family protein [Roseomonas sp. OT10]